MLGDGEWAMTNKNIDCREYAKLAGGFYPSKFDAKAWVQAAKDAGMKYICITSRHHDGFSMFGTRYSDYNIVEATPYGRDVVRELAKECRKQGIRLHFYYSLLDWTREDYYPLGTTGQGTGRTAHGDWNDYLGFMNNQLTELLTGYGPFGSTVGGTRRTPTGNWIKFTRRSTGCNPAVWSGTITIANRSPERIFKRSSRIFRDRIPPGTRLGRRSAPCRWKPARR